MAKIIHNREECIGCGACVATAPEFFEAADDGKITLKNSKKTDGVYIREIKDTKIDKAQEAVEACPVNAIKVEK